MRNLTHHLYEYFYYTRAERNASVVLSCLCLFFFLVPNFYDHIFPPPPPMDFSGFRAAIVAAAAEQSVTESNMAANRPLFRSDNSETVPVELFNFDPNTASKDELIRLGLSPRTVQTLLNFRSKGGKFFKKEDLKKVYGLRQEDYERLEEWVTILSKEPDSANERFATTSNADSFTQKEEGEATKKALYTKKEFVPVNIDINKATVEEWQQLNGIGPGYSKRIVSFRDKLGGFVTVDQVGETYGLPDSVFQKIIPYLLPSPISKKIAVNECSLDELKSHPYLNSYQATILFNFRKQHGRFGSMEELKKIKAGFKEEDWDRLKPYLAFE